MNVRDGPPQPAPRPIRVNEECANARRVDGGIQQRILGLLHLVATEQRSPSAPSAGCDGAGRSIDDVVGPIRDELCVDAEHRVQRRVDLRGGVVSAAETAHRVADQLLDRGDVARGGGARDLQHR